jgi:rod shape determining protein RodA
MMDRRLWREPSFDLIGKVIRVNWLYVLLLCALAAVGYVALYSAAGGSPQPYAARHAIRFGVGIVLMLGIGLTDIRLIAKLAWPTWAGGVILLVLVLRMGHVGKGAQRWLELGGLQMQPSEMMKLALILALASWFHRASWERIGNPLFLVPPVIAILIPVGLILKEPNLGTAAITAMLGAAIFFAAGVRWWKFLLVVLPVPLLARFVYAHMHDYQRARIDTFMNPESDPLGAG